MQHHTALLFLRKGPSFSWIRGWVIPEPFWTMWQPYLSIP